jgi:hypothetical protein
VDAIELMVGVAAAIILRRKKVLIQYFMSITLLYNYFLSFTVRKIFINRSDELQYYNYNIIYPIKNINRLIHLLQLC